MDVQHDADGTPDEAPRDDENIFVAFISVYEDLGVSYIHIDVAHETRTVRRITASEMIRTKTSPALGCNERS